MIGNILKGYNSTLFAYGATGTGKTHTTFGNMHSIIDDSTPIEKGICMFAVDHLFNYISNNENITSVKVFLNLYRSVI